MNTREKFSVQKRRLQKSSKIFVFLFITSMFSRSLLNFLVSFCSFKVYVLFTCDFLKTLPDFGNIEMDPTQSLSLKFQSDLTSGSWYKLVSMVIVTWLSLMTGKTLLTTPSRNARGFLSHYSGVEEHSRKNGQCVRRCENRRKSTSNIELWFL